MGNGLSKIRERYVDFWASLGIDARAEYGVVGAGSIFRCGVLSFLCYFLPIALLRRKLADKHHFRSAVAFGAFGAAYRMIRVSISRVFSQVFERRKLLFSFSPIFVGASSASHGSAAYCWGAGQHGRVGD